MPSYMWSISPRMPASWLLLFSNLLARKSRSFSRTMRCSSWSGAQSAPTESASLSSEKYPWNTVISSLFFASRSTKPSRFWFMCSIVSFRTSCCETSSSTFLLAKASCSRTVFNSPLWKSTSRSLSRLLERMISMLFSRSVHSFLNASKDPSLDWMSSRTSRSSSMSSMINYLVMGVSQGQCKGRAVPGNVTRRVLAAQITLLLRGSLVGVCG
mmetsp:Transcript_6352/g.14036  ORF Transcript_6352/g.14036 Transcript_6352/m.14036 type:complete len:213 (-) Transcript_6352:4-642(-)